MEKLIASLFAEDEKFGVPIRNATQEICPKFDRVQEYLAVKKYAAAYFHLQFLKGHVQVISEYIKDTEKLLGEQR